MSEATRIEWADATWNPMTGCTKVSPACDHCYAERIARRFGWTRPDGFRPETDVKELPSTYFTPTFHPDRLDVPLHWRKPRRIFVCSMSDLFHEAFTDEQIARVWATMHGAPKHTFMVLTKRPERMREWLSRCADWEGYVTHDGTPPAKAYEGTGIIVGTTTKAHPDDRLKSRQYQRRLQTWPLPNLWLGVTAEDQQRADERIPVLLDTPAARHFVSCEPMLGPVDLTRLRITPDDGFDALQPYSAHRVYPGTWDYEPSDKPGLDWVIVGGETGPGARPMQPEWALDVYRQCKAAGVPFFFKKWAASGPIGEPSGEVLRMTSTREHPDRQEADRGD